MTARKKIGIVTPCYNEEETVAECHATVKALFAGPLSDYDYEHLFCDNCSTDATLERLRAIAGADSNVRVIANSRNFGAFRNLFNGTMAVGGDAVVPFLPADLQDPPDLLPTFVQHWEDGYKVVYGIRANREESWPMRTMRRWFYRLVNHWSPFEIPQNAGEFQLIDRVVVENLRAFDDHFPYLRGMIAYCGFDSIGVSYTWKKRGRGLSKSSASSLIEDGLNGLISFSMMPIRIALFAGFALASLSILVALIMLIINLIYYRELAPPGIPLLTVSLFFFAGFQLFFMGLLGEYILAIHSQVRRRPLVIERERVNFLDNPQREQEV
ncbi:MAG: glycosyltransferase family 2 protein [Gemmatimonadetes bacterium]|nr:glycosyltransferase family 2 protein [Gemmatimonadota bacterium]